MRSKRSVCLMKSGCLGWSTLIGRRKFKARELNRRRAKPTPPALFMLLECDIVGRRGTGSRCVKLDEKWNFSSSFSPSSLLPLLSFPFSRKERSTAAKKNARNTLVYLFFFFQISRPYPFYSILAILCVLLRKLNKTMRIY